MAGILGIAFFVTGLIQFAAIVNGFVDSLGLLGYPAAFFLAEVPILGTVMGIRGAVNSWGWSVGASLALFLGIPAAGFLIGLIRARRE